MQPGNSTDEVTDKRLANLRPAWKPGQSGNPGGKNKRLEEVKALAREKSMRSLERLVELVESHDERVALMAAKEVMVWAFGSPGKQEDEGDRDNRSLTINIVRYSDGNKPAPQLESEAISIRTLALP